MSCLFRSTIQSSIPTGSIRAEPTSQLSTRPRFLSLRVSPTTQYGTEHSDWSIRVLPRCLDTPRRESTSHYCATRRLTDRSALDPPPQACPLRPQRHAYPRWVNPYRPRPTIPLHALRASSTRHVVTYPGDPTTTHRQLNQCPHVPSQRLSTCRYLTRRTPAGLTSSIRLVMSVLTGRLLDTPCRLDQSDRDPSRHLQFTPTKRPWSTSCHTVRRDPTRHLSAGQARPYLRLLTPAPSKAGRLHMPP